MSASLASSAPRRRADDAILGRADTRSTRRRRGNTDYLRIRGGARTCSGWAYTIRRRVSLVLADSPLKFRKKQHIGLGFHDAGVVGLFSNLGLNIQASYKLRVLKGTLSIGVEGGLLRPEIQRLGSQTPTAATTTRVPTRPCLPKTSPETRSTSLTRPGIHPQMVLVRHRRETLLAPKITLSPLKASEASDEQGYETELPRIVYFPRREQCSDKNSLFGLQPSFLVKTGFSIHGRSPLCAHATTDSSLSASATDGKMPNKRDGQSGVQRLLPRIFLRLPDVGHREGKLRKPRDSGRLPAEARRLGRDRNKHRSIRLMAAHA